MKNGSFLFILFLCLALCVCDTSSTHVFYIKPDNDTFSLCPDPCLTLDNFAEMSTSSFQSLSLVFLPGMHSLTSTLVVENKMNSTFKPASAHVSIQCHTRGFLLFINVDNLWLETVSFLSCSDESNYGISILNTVAVLSNVTISGSLGGPMSISNSTVQMNNIIFFQNAGYYSSIKVSFSSVFFGGENIFAQNFGEIAGFSANNSNLTFHGSTSFVENTGAFLFGLAGLSITECQLLNFGDMIFLRNSGPQVLSVDHSLVVSHGTFEFTENKIGQANSLLNLEVTVYITYSNITYDSFKFINNQGSIYFFYSPFTVIKQLEVSENTLIQDYPHAIFTLQGSYVRWTGNALFFKNTAKFGGTAGIQSVFQTIEVTGNISIVCNSAQYSAGLLLSGSSLQLIGNLVIGSNSALEAAAGLTLLAGTMHIVGFLHISENTANSNTSAVVVAQLSSVINVTGYFEFLDNRGHNRAFCILFGSSTCVFNGHTLIQGNVGNRPPHFFQNSDITFAGVSQIRDNIVSDDYGGGLGLSQSVLRLKDRYCFENNQAPTDNGGAIYAIDSTIIFSGTGNFTNNSAIRGGALQLFYRSRISLLSGVTVLFNENTALAGGAIHVEEVVSFINCTNDIRLRGVYAEPPVCFFDTNFISNESISLVFEGNEATEGGSALYGGMLDRCVFSNQPQQSALDIFTSISHLSSSNASSLSSDPFQLCFCEDGAPNCNLQQVTVQSRRGEQFSVSVLVLNELQVGIVALVRSYLVSGFNDSNKILGDGGVLQEVGSECTDLQYRVSSVNDIEQLTMYAEGPCRDVGNASKMIQVVLQECPLGFELVVESCVCDPQLLPFTNTCNVDTGGIERPTNFWIGTDFDSYGNFTGLILYPNCPFDYCLFPSPSIELTSPDAQCNYNRSGVLCGSCMNSSLLLGSSACSDCTNYYLFLLIPFSVMGVLLVACLFLLQLTVATGALHGLIFYANIVTVNKAVLVPTETFKGLSIFLSWLNLDFGIKSCFFDGMDQYAKTWLQFVFPLYLLTLVFLIIIVCHYSSKASRFFGSNPVAALATVILLSYTKVLQTILAVFSFASLEHSTKSEIVWLFDGKFNYGQGHHAILFAFSLLLFVFLILPYTIVLVSAQLLRKVKWISSTSLMKNLIPFIDAYHAPYKPTHQYWTGLFLLVRGILLTTFSLNSLGNPSVNLLAITTVCFCTCSLSWMIGGVYNKKFLDPLEALFILNLGLFAAATYHVRASDGTSQPTLANISLFLSFILFLSVIGVHAYFRLVLLNEYFQSRRKYSIDMHKKQQDKNLLTVSADGFGDTQNRNQPTIQIVPSPRKDVFDGGALREPLLEES